MTTNSLRRRPLSWQQEGRLRRDGIRIKKRANVVGAYPLPRNLPDDVVVNRIAEMVRREESLRVVDFGIDGEGYQAYADAVQLPVVQLQLETQEQVFDYVTAEATSTLSGTGAPAWRAALIGYGTGPSSQRLLCGSFDDTVYDGRSLSLFLDEVATGRAPRRSVDCAYSEWVRFQRDKYPDPSYGVADSDTFWREYLADAAPDREIPLSFCTNPRATLSGIVQCLPRTSSVPASRIREAAARARCTPFMLILGAVAHATAMFSDSDDLMFRVYTSGRLPRFASTQGCFSDSIPVRIRAGGLRQATTAVEAANSTWKDLLPYFGTPWDYLLRAFTGGGWDEIVQRRSAQVLINFLPETVPSAGKSPPSEPFAYEREVGTFRIHAGTWDDDTCRLWCDFDPARFATEGAEEFMDCLCGTLEAVVS